VIDKQRVASEPLRKRVRNPLKTKDLHASKRNENRQGEKRMGSEPKQGGAVGKWRDMHGDLWERTAEGGRRRAS
jgi:hypothetical protein